MACVIEQAPDGHPPDGDLPQDNVELNHLGSLVVAVLAGAGLAWAARTSALALLIAVAVVQALLVLAWVFGTRLPGAKGAVVVAALAAGGADVTVSIWPHGRLGTLLIVFGLSLPVMFVHQLMRGAARLRIVESLGAVAMAVVGVVALPALLQLRHEFSTSSTGGKVVSGVVAAAAGALIVGYLVDLVMPAPRFDPAVARGLLAVVASAGLGGSVGHLMLENQANFLAGRGTFVGAAVGALVAFFAVATAFIEYATPVPEAGFARRVRPVLSALLPLSLLAPVAFLLCLAIRA
ncbi:MAG: conserved rane protein of unknown function [Pseudonocardiales bacterium]|nr:conserved rane protein of unknown function [Pseudonocardiales bacterium]